ncbi:MAG TPA: T9SS type A sorting domain-containing protein [Melioribacteraceae bacterium]|nr:T9SS type A sorting domain-containing protein [Melioribacteraceae bacterium]
MIRNSKKVFLAVLFYFISSLIPAQTIDVVPKEPYMGKIPVGSKAVRQIQIYNISPTALNISSISLSNTQQFRLLNNPGTTTVGLAEFFALQIEFSPTGGGPFTSELTINSNASTSPNKYTITGYGTSGAKPSFERIFGGVDDDGVGSIQQLSDGSYLLGGSTRLADREYSDFYIVKTNNSGEVLWSHSYGVEDLGEGVGHIEERTDGSFILFGSKQTFKNGPSDLYFAKLNADRTVAWEKIFGGADEENSGTFVNTPDGGFLLAGTTRSFSTSTQVYLIKTDQNGNKVWEKNFGGNGGDAGKKIIPTRDGNYMILATTSSKGSGDFDVYLLKVTGNGDLVWDKTFGGTKWDEGTDIAQLSDGSYIISGYSQSYTSDRGHEWLLLKADESGNFLWNKTFGSSNPYQDYASRIAVASDGFVLAGTIDLQIQPRTINDMLVIKTDFNGNEIWRSQLGGSESEGAGGLLVNSDGHYVIAGSTGSYSSRGDVYFLNLNTSGQIITSLNDREQELLPYEVSLYNNYPNPFNNQTRITYQVYKPAEIELTINDLLGRRISILDEGFKSPGLYTVAFNSDRLASGVYFCVLKTRSNILVNKIMLLK